LTSVEARQPHRAGLLRAERGLLVIDQSGVADQFGQHHRHGLERLDLDFLVAARIGMLDAEHAHRTLAPHDRHAGERVVLVFPGFGAIGKVRMGGRLGQVERLDILGDGADQAFADRHAGDVDRFLRQPLRREQFKHGLRAAGRSSRPRYRGPADHVDNGVELGLNMAARGHHIVQAGQDGPGGAWERA
jgi:hypothetical protein